MRMYDIIHKKRCGGELTREEISFFINGYTGGSIPDYQASALCMAIYFRGMTERETVALTDCMAHSGDTVDLSCFGELSADKHSTGGVGDKTTLIVGPIVASLGGKMAKMSGRGLGHTGGTVDKLEAIPGYRTSLGVDEFLRQVEKIGIAVIGQTGNLAPADKKLYALRDVTATVDSIPLITSSIMSKKLAAGAKNIVLDVKVGSGAFMKTAEQAEELAHAMVKIGKSCGRNITAVLTNMDVPLGCTVGNALEIAEAADVLHNGEESDLKTVCEVLAANIVSMVKKIDYDAAMEQVRETVSSKKAYEKMKEWIAAQGGDISCIEDPHKFAKPQLEIPVLADRDGCIASMDAELIGDASVILGAGRASKEDVIDHSAGIILCKKTGDKVKKGETLCRLYTNRAASIESAKELFCKALVLSDAPLQSQPLIYKIIR